VSFDTLAPHYRWMELLLAGGALQECRTRFLGELDRSREVLVLGPGRGGFTRALLTRWPDVRVTLLDSSRGMLGRVRRDLRSAGLSTDRVTLVHDDVQRWAPPTPCFDAVATHFFLDCFEPTELRALVARVARWTTPRACWLVSDFRVPDGGWRRRRAQAIHALMYAFFRATTHISANRLTPPDVLLGDAGFRLDRRVVSNFGLLHTDLWVRGIR